MTTDRRGFIAAVAAAVVSAAQHGRRDAVDQQAVPPGCDHREIEKQWAQMKADVAAQRERDGFGFTGGATCVRCGATFSHGRWFRRRRPTHTTRSA